MPSSIILVAILLSALVVRLGGIAEYMPSSDELQFFMMAKADTIAEIWQRNLAELHPPLAQILRHFLFIFGDDFYLHRLFSIVAGMVALWGMYVLGKDMHGRELGLFMAASMVLMPMPVLTSITLRPYAFFMAFAAWALVYFVRYLRNWKKRDLAYFSALILCASACHFSGFFIAAGCGLALAVECVPKRRWKDFRWVCMAYLPLAVLAVFFYVHYLAPGTAGPMWKTLTVETGFLNDNNVIPALLAHGIGQFFHPIQGFLSVFNEQTLWIGNLLVLFFLSLLMVLYGVGVYRLYQQQRSVAVWVLCMWAVAFILVLSGMYPGSTPRHSYYLFPVLMLPIGYALLHPLQRVVASHKMAYGAALAMLLCSAALAHNRSYLNQLAEFTLTQDDFYHAQDYMHLHIHPHDAIIGTRIAGYTYLVYDKEHGRVGYHHYTDMPYVKNTMLVGPFNPPDKPHTTIAPLYDQLKEQAQGVGNLWFVTYGYRNIEMEKLASCALFSPYMEHVHIADGVFMFSVSRADMRQFTRDRAAFEHCFPDYMPYIVADGFSKDDIEALLAKH